MIPQNKDNAVVGHEHRNVTRLLKRRGTTIECCVALESGQQLDWARTLYMCKEKPTGSYTWSDHMVFL